MTDALMAGDGFQRATGAGDVHRVRAWWWVGLPVAATVFLLALIVWLPDFYLANMQPEHTGWLERLHFALPFIAGVLFVQAALTQPAGLIPLLRICLFVLAAASFYWALEEESWGQHSFKWETPGLWAAINRQNETNLHNSSWWLAQLPRTVMLAGIIVGGILLPVARTFLGSLRPRLIEILTPPMAILPAALSVVMWKAFQDIAAVHNLVAWPPGFRHGEASETFYSIFLLFYAVLLTRRTAMLGDGT